MWNDALTTLYLGGDDVKGVMRKVKSKRLGFWPDLDRSEPDSYLEKGTRIRQIVETDEVYWRSTPFSVGPYLKVHHPTLGYGYVLSEGLEE